MDSRFADGQRATRCCAVSSPTGSTPFTRYDQCPISTPSPSGVNLQPRRFVVVRDAAIRRRIREADEVEEPHCVSSSSFRVDYSVERHPSGPVARQWRSEGAAIRVVRIGCALARRCFPEGRM